MLKNTPDKTFFIKSKARIKETFEQEPQDAPDRWAWVHPPPHPPSPNVSAVSGSIAKLCMSRDRFPLTLQVWHHHHLRLGEPLRQVEEVQGAVKAEEADLGAGITRQPVQLLGQRLCEKTQVACNTAKAVVMFCKQCFTLTFL